MEFHLGLQQCKGESLTLQIVNVSEDEAGLFSLLETKNIYAYSEYSDGYLFNGVYGEEGSILCNFKFMTGKHYYMGLTYAFWVLILSLLCTHFILRGFAWLQRRTCR